MIHGVYANQKSFRSIKFKPGLNIILAEKTEMSTQRDSRNGLGKSTLIEIIDFCFGSTIKKGKGLGNEILSDWAFTIDITLAGNRVRATRKLEKSNQIAIDGPTTGWIEQPILNEENGNYYLSVIQWKKLLGWTMFDLMQDKIKCKYKPSFRSLISYFIRRGSDAYSDPFSHFRKQGTGDIQLQIAYLLGLNWEYASQWQVLRDQENALKAIEAAIKTGAIDSIVGSKGELEAERARLQRKFDIERSALDEFQVLPQYEEIQADANRLTRIIHNLVNQNVIVRRKFNLYEEAVTVETPPSDLKFQRLYEEVGVVFPDIVKKNIEESQIFHRKIIVNRKKFLADEINRLRNQIKSREKEIVSITNERASLLTLLKTHGALKEYSLLQEKQLATKESLDKVISRISNIRDASKRRRDYRISKEELLRKAEQDHEERRELWEKAMLLFNESSEALYEMPGRLSIDITETGYKYRVDIERSDSTGIGKMKIFCFDFMLSKLENNRIDFLIHDSIIFDGVDSRQCALAIERAAALSDNYKMQYICPINSDMVPRSDFSPKFDFDSYVRLTLTDKYPSGSLLGFRY